MAAQKTKHEIASELSRAALFAPQQGFAQMTVEDTAEPDKLQIVRHYGQGVGMVVCFRPRSNNALWSLIHEIADCFMNQKNADGDAQAAKVKRQQERERVAREKREAARAENVSEAKKALAAAQQAPEQVRGSFLDVARHYLGQLDSTDQAKILANFQDLDLEEEDELIAG